MVLSLICIIALMIYLLWRQYVIQTADIEKTIQEETEASIIQIMQTQNELNNAAFAARKALIEEALKLSQISKQNHFHSEM